MDRFLAAAGRVVLLGVLASGIPATAWSAGATEADLAGVRGVRVTVSQTTPDAMSCGIDLRGLLPVVSERLAKGGLSVDPSAEVTVTLTVLTGYDGASGVCASAPMLGAYRRVSFFDEKVGWLRSGQLVLWQRGTASATASADHAEAVRQAVASLSEAFLASWRDTNSGGLANR